MKVVTVGEWGLPWDGWVYGGGRKANEEHGERI